jgi:hypothetical protein
MRYKTLPLRVLVADSERERRARLCAADPRRRVPIAPLRASTVGVICAD